MPLGQLTNDHFCRLFSGNELERALKKIGREDVIRKCMYNIEAVTDLKEQAVAWEELNQPGNPPCPVVLGCG